MRIPKNAFLSIGLTVFGLVAVGYQIATYSGLYRLASDLQLRLFGLYFPLISAVTLAIFLLPGQIAAPDRIEARRPLDDEFATFEELAIHKQQRFLSRILHWIPVAALAAGAAFLVAQTQSAALPAPIPIDLSAIGDARPPIGVPVMLAGTADVDHAGNISTLGRAGEDQNAVPLVGPRFDGIYRYFADLGRSDLEARNRLSGLARTGRIEGTLSENGLPGEMRALLETSGLRIGEPHYYLGPDGVPPGTLLMRWSGLLLGIAALLALLALNAWRLIRKHRRRMAEWESG